MKHRSLFVFFLGIVLSLIATQKGFCWSPIVKSPAIQGQVVDLTTKQPIENAVISVVYYKEVPALVDRIEKPFTSYTTIADKDGKFTVPAKTSFHMPPLLIVGSWFWGRDINIYHPLYITAGTVHIGGSEVNIINKNPDGSLQYEIRLLSLEEKYKINQETEEFVRKDIKPIDFYSELETFDNAFYWNILRQYNIKVNIEQDFYIWEQIANKFPDGASNKILAELKERIKKNLQSGK